MLAAALVQQSALAQTPTTTLAPDSRQAAICEQKLEPERIEVRAHRSPVVYDRSTSAEVLTRRAPRGIAGEHALGMTERHFEMQVAWQSSYLTLDQGKTGCLRPRLKVDLMLHPTVYVAREFAPGSCAYEAIRAHEMRHVRANEQAFESAAWYLEQRMTQHFGGRIFYGNVDTMLAELDESIETVWLPAVRGKFAAFERVHAAIDSSAEYASNQTACEGEVLRGPRAARGR